MNKIVLQFNSRINWYSSYSLPSRLILKLRQPEVLRYVISPLTWTGVGNRSLNHNKFRKDIFFPDGNFALLGNFSLFKSDTSASVNYSLNI